MPRRTDRRGDDATPAAAGGADDWDEHWSNYAQSAQRNPAQEYRRRILAARLGADGVPRRVLDVGSGQGDLVASLLRRWPHAEFVGVELSATGVSIAARKVPGARFLQRNLLEPATVESADREWATHAVCSEVLEHVDDPVAVLRNATAYLAPGCRTVVTVPGGPMSAFDRHIGHRKHYRAAELASVLSQAAFHVERIEQAGFPFFNLYRLVVIARGRKLVDDVAFESDERLSPTARAVMAGFNVAFRANLPRTPWGWQLIAVCRRDH